MNLRLLALAALLPATLAAQSAPLLPPLLQYADPPGDDRGDGRLLYPREAVYESGDLDLRSLQVHEEGDQLRFEIGLAQPIRHPASLKSGTLGNEDLSVFARRGFYAFNLDLYLDTDRRTGSGQQALLPGRGGRIDPAHAWERAIVVTPRPELMQRQLRDAVAEATGSDEATAEATVAAAVHFVRDLRVRGRSLSFTVPQRFVAARALPQSSLIAVLTAAQLTIPAELGRSARWSSSPAGAAEAAPRLSLGVAQPQAGQPATTMGWTGSRPPATAIVDLLAPDAAAQTAQLGSGTLVGLGGRVAAPTLPGAAKPPTADPAAQRLAQALAVLTGVGETDTPPPPAVAPPRPVVAAPSTPSTPSAAPAAPPAAAAAAAPTPPAATPPALPLASSPTVAATAAPVAAPAASGAARASATPARRDPAFLEEQELRLKTLRRLRDHGLITEEEFQRKRKEIIDAL